MGRNIAYISMLFILAFTGCVTTTMLNRAYEPNYTSDIEVFVTQKPDRPYIEIAEITSATRSPFNRAKINMDNLIEKAKELGANAIIMTGPAGKAEGTEYGRKAIAIRWKDKVGGNKNDK